MAYNDFVNNVHRGDPPPKLPPNTSLILSNDAIAAIQGAMSNPIAGSQTQNILSNIQGSLKGQNPVGKGTSLNELNFFDNTSILQPRKTFFQALQHWTFSTPQENLWAVIITLPEVLVRHGVLRSEHMLERLQEFDNRMGSDMAVSHSVTKLFQYTTGCLFAQGVAIPPESVAAEFVQPVGNSGGLIGFPLFKNRAPFVPLRVTFRETNVSFLDFIIRPWLIIASHLGLTERDPSVRLSVKADIHVINFAKAGSALKQEPSRDGDGTKDSENLVNVVPLIPRKIWRFLDCVPTRLPQSQYSYGSNRSQNEAKEIEFIYSDYEVYMPEHYINQAISLSQESDAQYSGGRATANKDAYKAPATQDKTVNQPLNDRGFNKKRRKQNKRRSVEMNTAFDAAQRNQEMNTAFGAATRRKEMETALAAGTRAREMNTALREGARGREKHLTINAAQRSAEMNAAFERSRRVQKEARAGGKK